MGMSYEDSMNMMLRQNPDEAIKLLERDDEAGNLEATFLLGKVYFDGIYAKPNADKCIEYWSKGASKGSVDCQCYLGDCHFLGFGYPEDNDAAFSIYQEILNRDPHYAKARCQIGRMHGHGWGFEQDVYGAIPILEQAWNDGSAQAASEIGLLYLFHMDKTVDNLRAGIKWCQRGADHGSDKGCYRIGISYYYGDYGLPKSNKMAYQYFLKGIDSSDCLSLLITSNGCDVASPDEMKDIWTQCERRAGFGDSALQEALGEAYSKGKGVEPNVELATYWYEKAAESGNTFAEYQLGMKYVLAMDGFTKDESKAYRHLLHAAQAGERYAMKPLADLLDDSYIPEVPYDEQKKQMMYWYEKAADQGDEWAAMTVARKYENGYSPVDKDIDKAIHYYQIAAEHDIESAFLPLANLYMQTGNPANYKLAFRYATLMKDKAKADYEKGEVDLCFARMYRDGFGVEKNLEKAFQLYSSAVKYGNYEAEEEIKHFKKTLFGWKLI